MKIAICLFLRVGFFCLFVVFLEGGQDKDLFDLNFYHQKYYHIFGLITKNRQSYKNFNQMSSYYYIHKCMRVLHNIACIKLHTHTTLVYPEHFLRII